MIEWNTLAPGLRALFSDMAFDSQPDPVFEAQWEEGAKQVIHPDVGAELSLKVTAVSNVGLDELRYRNEGESELIETVVGTRNFTLQARVSSHFHGPSVDEWMVNELTGWCWTITERLRTSIRRSRNRAALEALNVALVNIGPAVDASFKFEKRRVNAAVCDFFFSTAFCDDDPIKVGWIERIELTSLIRGVDDVLLASPPNITEELIPPLEG
jgi:hypothetical protein